MNSTLSNSSHQRNTGVALSDTSPAYQAFRILHIGFVIAPILAGLDKFFYFLVNWDQYVPSVITQLSPSTRTHNARRRRHRDRSGHRCGIEAAHLCLRGRGLARTDHCQLV